MDLPRVLAADRAHVWHPYTPMDEWRARHDPLVVVRAEGPWLELASGERLLDGNASWWVSTLGHNHPRLVEALRRQSERLCHVALAGITHEPAALLAEELAAVAPRGLDQVFYSDDGSTAIEAAVKMALQFHAQRGAPKKTRFVALDGAFHGETIGATSLGGVEVFRRPFASVVFDCVHVPSPAGEDVSCAPLWGEAFDAIAELVEREHETIAAVVLEPIVQGAAGMRMYPPAYLRAVRDLCTRHDVLLIIDEVFTGYGRLGAMWGCDLAEVVPDLMCIAKGFTGGLLPMAATLTSQRVLSAFDGGRARAFLYGHSYCGNPLGAAVAREVLAIYREEPIVAGVAERHARIVACGERLRARIALVREVRAVGAIGAFELSAVPAVTAPSAVPTISAPSAVPTLETTDDLGYTASIGWRVYDEARRRGAYLRPLGDVVYVTPPLNIPLPDLDRLLSIVEESIAAVA
ncbi:MAG: adenosylmethionine--8-amino-7-oxononanoate transaminase [Deltaproteobacteria bacterium]|nr:adenosylmethionine--8-amino-7-oxononanoate transaminase [Deltaproteobacteria bacterium]